jgi:DNA-directed RNA polymerase specialized sigma24 family protein
VVARTELLDAADSELLALARTGESEAFGILYERHVAAARQLAYQLAATPRLADDIVTEAFGRMQDVIARGGGPSSAVRLYVLTAVRRVCYERLQGAPGQPPADGATLPDPDQLLVDPAFTGLDTALVARAYQSLPERSRAVLWHTEIEQDPPADVAPLLGVTRNGVGAARRRAMDDLRQAYLQLHISLITQPACRPVAERLVAFDRRSLTARDAALVSEHLARCEGCQVVHRELADITAALRSVVAPLVLGSASAAYLADAGHHGPVVTAGATHPGAGIGGAGGDLLPGSMPPGGEVARLPAHETALLPGPDQFRKPRAHRRSLRDSLRQAPRSRRIAAAAAVGVVLAATASIALAMTLIGNDNAPASAGQLPSAAARHAASTQPSPSPTPPPSPSPSPSISSPPAAPAPAPVRLTASLSVSRRGSSGHPETVGFQVTNTGSAMSGPLTAVIALPAGSSLFSGSGGNEEGTGSLNATALFSAWSCQPTSGGATCTHAALAAGQQTGDTLLIALSGSAACGQAVRLTITSGGATASATDAIPC